MHHRHRMLFWLWLPLAVILTVSGSSGHKYLLVRMDSEDVERRPQLNTLKT